MTHQAIIAQDDPRDRLHVILGDDKEPLFLPQGKLLRWGNEVNLSVRLLGPDYANATTRARTGRIIWETASDRVDFYQLPADRQHPAGAFEFEVVLLSKPASSRLQFSLQTKGVEFYYQPHEVSEPNATRPEHIKGSYAVYRTASGLNVAGGKLYRAGKVAHIYRPKAIDYEGNEVWCALDITGDVLTITIPNIFLQSASYPVIVDPTFGYDTAGGSNGDVGSASIYSSGAGAPASDGTATAIYTYSKVPDDDTDVTVGLYDDDTGPADIVGTENETIGVSQDLVAGWRSFNTNALALTNGVTYWPSLDPDKSLDQYYDNAGGTNRYWDTHTHGDAWPATHAQDTQSAAKYSMYCEYTAAGGLSIPVAEHHYMHHVFG